jgi:beta-glucosidase
VYLSRPDSALERPVRWLAGFARVSADPGDTVTVDVRVPRRQFAHWSPADHSWAYEPGRFEVLAGYSVASTPLCGTWEITPDQRWHVLSLLTWPALKAPNGTRPIRA